MRRVPLVCTKGSPSQIRWDLTCRKSLPPSSHEILAVLAAPSGAISLPHLMLESRPRRNALVRPKSSPQKGICKWPESEQSRACLSTDHSPPFWAHPPPPPRHPPRAWRPQILGRVCPMTTWHGPACAVKPETLAARADFPPSAFGQRGAACHAQV